MLRRVDLDELIGARYRAPFDFVGPGSADDPDGDPASWRFVVTDEFVRTDEGTGIVHIGAAYGKDDMRVARAHGVPEVEPVDAQGRLDHRTGPFAGMYVRDADQPIIRHLEQQGLLLPAGTQRHTFPFCWCCGTPLLYYAKRCWYLSTSRLRGAMLTENASIDWRPAHVRDGRFRDWLAGNEDWALSRERFWGTPLPLWRCADCDRTVAVGSVAELERLACQDLGDLDPHRPAVDAITIPCGECGGTMRRVPDVVDAWYDSGAMPFAQFGYPHEPGSVERFGSHHPSDLICGTIDQTRGWFYSLLAVSTLLFERSSYQRVLCLDDIVDEDARKVAGTAGSALDPWDLIDRHGADPVRWFLLAEGTPWQSRRISEDAVRNAARKVVHTLWNVHYFFATYAKLSGWSPEGLPEPQHVMDRWILAELTDTVSTARNCLHDFDSVRAGRRIAGFVDDLSNWYVRRSRERFAERHTKASDQHAAFATLHHCLTEVAGLLAPFTPFLADELYESLVRSVDPAAKESVHLTGYPLPRDEWSDQPLSASMSVALRLVTLGRDARNTSGIPVRQPLPRATVTVPRHEKAALAEVAEVIADELNVQRVEVATESKPVSRTLRSNYGALGPAFGPRTRVVAETLERLDVDDAARQLQQTGALEVELEAETVEVTAGQVKIVEQPREGWQISTEGDYRVALDTTMDRELRLEGMARELTRLVNDLRRRRGLQLGDRIALRVEVLSDPEGTLAEMLRRRADALAVEVGAEALEYGAPTSASQAPGDAGTTPLGGGRLRLILERAEASG